ncbi:MAG: DNA polymerase III subunit beta [candidate division WOR-3 bacterium]
MKFHVEKNLFEENVKSIIAALPSRTTLPILENILIEAKEKIYLSCTNLELSSKINFEAKTLEEGIVAVDGKRLYKLLNDLPSELIECSLVSGDFVIRFSKGEYKFRIMDPEDFPKIEKFESNVRFEIDSNILLKGIQKVSFCVAKNDPRAYLNGILFEFKEGRLNIVASDAHKLGLYTFPYEADISERIIVNPKIEDFIESRKGEKINIFVKENNMCIDFKNGFYLIRLIDETYPAYQDVIPKEPPNVFECNKKDLLDTLKRLIPFTTSPNYPIKMSLSSGNVVITAQSPEFGEAKEEIPCEYTGKTMEVGFNARYLQEIVKEIDEDTVIIKFTEPERAALIKGYAAENYLFLLMPIRL